MNNILPVGSIVKLSKDSALPIMVLGFFPYDRDEHARVCIWLFPP